MAGEGAEGVVSSAAGGAVGPPTSPEVVSVAGAVGEGADRARIKKLFFHNKLLV